MGVDGDGLVKVLQGFFITADPLPGTAPDNVNGFTGYFQQDGFVAVDQAGIVFFQEEVGSGPVHIDIGVVGRQFQGTGIVFEGPLVVRQLAPDHGAVDENIGHIR